MKWLFAGLVLVACVCGTGLGRMDAVTVAALSECGTAVELAISLAGSMCLWSGLMRIADRSGLTGGICRMLTPVTRLLFPGVQMGSAAAKSITMNITANLLGLGNAATPSGLSAMKELARDSPTRGIASRDMMMFVVLNTMSIQLIPTTTALLRAGAGAAVPLDILPVVWSASLASVLAGLTAARLLEKGRRLR